MIAAAREGAVPPPSAAEAFAGELARQRPYLMQFARRRLRDDALVEDVVQETLLAAWQGASAFQRRATLRTWLTSILQRRIVDAVRAVGRLGRHTRPATLADDHEAHAEPDDADGRPSDEPVDWIDPPRRLEGRQFLDALALCLDGMPEPAARIFALRTLDGLSNEQAALAMGLEPRRASVLMHRTLSRLRNGLSTYAHAPAAA
jgi:RNA polymerase sigma-70 factor (ECF subfamily)